MIVARKPGVLSALVVLMASGLALAETSSVSADVGAVVSAGGAPEAGRGPGGPDVARLLLQASLSEIMKSSSLAAAATNIGEALETAAKNEREARAALDQALVPQLRNGAIDASALSSLITAVEEAQQASKVALVQAVDDARSLLSDEQRASVVAAVKAQLAQGPDGSGGQGAGGPPPGGPGGQSGPPPGGGAPPSEAGASGSVAGSAGSSGSSEASSARLDGDPLLAGITLTVVQKQALISLGYLGSEASNGSSLQGPPPQGAPPSGGPPGGGVSSVISTATAGTAQAASQPKMPGSELLEAFVSTASELPLPTAPTTTGTSPTAERVRKLAILAEVLDTEQRETLVTRLSSESAM